MRPVIFLKNQNNKMLLPAKHIKLSESLIALGAFILRTLENPKNIDQIWLEIKKINNSSFLSVNHSYDNFLLSVDFLYIIGVIDIDNQGNIFICN